jgi:hypothetical protein
MVFLGVTALNAKADTLQIVLPLVNGVPTLSGAPGEVITVDATITPSTSLVLGDVSISQSSTEGITLGTDTSVYMDPGNPFYPAEASQNIVATPLTSPTTGGLFTITFPDGAPFGITEIDYTLYYGDSISQSNQFNGYFDVDFEPVAAPEPGTGLLLAGALGVCALGRTLRTRSSRLVR